MESQQELLVEWGTGDVFHDLGLPDADELLAKSNLMIAIYDAIKRRKISQRALAKQTEMPLTLISKLVKGQISAFSSDQLIHILNKLDQDVVIYVRPRPTSEDRPAHVSVELAEAL